MSDGFQFVDFFSQVCELLHYLLRGFRIVPKAFSANAPVEFGYGAFFAIVVKDAP